jgi:hypothetical protein
MYCIQHYFICRPTDSTVLEDAGIEPWTIATTAYWLSPAINTRLKSHPPAKSHPCLPKHSPYEYNPCLERCPSVSVQHPSPEAPSPARLYLSVRLLSHFSGRFLPGHGGLTVAFGHNQNMSPSCCRNLSGENFADTVGDREARECHSQS